MNKKYTPEQIEDAVWSVANSLPQETLAEFYADDLYQFYRRSATEQELEEFMEENDFRWREDQ